MTITEPTTMITDYILTVIAVIAAVKLVARNSGARSVVYLAGSLLLIGIAATRIGAARPGIVQDIDDAGT